MVFSYVSLYSPLFALFFYVNYYLLLNENNFQIYAAGESPHAHEEEARGRGHQEQQVSPLPRKLSQRCRRSSTHPRRSPGNVTSALLRIFVDCSD